MKPPRFHFGLPFRAASDLEQPGDRRRHRRGRRLAACRAAHDVVALKQRYAGHAKRAGLIAAANSYMGAWSWWWDDDVDPSNLADVMWAITTR